MEQVERLLKAREADCNAGRIQIGWSRDQRSRPEHLPVAQGPLTIEPGRFCRALVIGAYSSPGIGFGGGSSGAGENFIQRLQYLRSQSQVEALQGTGELFHGAGSDNGSRHGWLM